MEEEHSQRAKDKQGALNSSKIICHIRKLRIKIYRFPKQQ